MENPRWFSNAIEKRSTFESENFIDECYKKAKHDLAIDKIDMDGFRDVYGDVIDSDLKYIEYREEDFRQQNSEKDEKEKKIATILEAIFCDQIELNEIFGEGVNTISTCPFDDYKNGIDFLLKVKEELENSKFKDKVYHYLAIALDATMSSRQDVLSKKINIIKDNIKNGKLAKIKYFESENSNHKGSLNNIPKFIIGVDRKNLEELSNLWIEGKNKELSQHPFQIIVLDQIRWQIDYFIEYAKSVEQNKIAEKFEELRIFFDHINEEKKDLRESIMLDSKKREKVEEDNVYSYFKNLKRNLPI